MENLKKKMVFDFWERNMVVNEWVKKPKIGRVAI